MFDARQAGRRLTSRREALPDAFAASLGGEIALNKCSSDRVIE
jgi:hypothetical protein